jgi:glutamate dehydrogenase (NAD(P)+)
MEIVMRRAFQTVFETSRKYRTHMRNAAYITAVGRVAEATTIRGLFP